MQLTFGGKLLLRQLETKTELLDLFANDICGLFCFAHDYAIALDNRLQAILHCYEIVTHYQTTRRHRMNQNQKIAFLRRLGPDPHANGALTPCLRGCPDILELEMGDFAVIGKDITEMAINHLPPTVGCGPDERIIQIPRKTLVFAKTDIPDTL